MRFQCEALSPAGYTAKCPFEGMVRLKVGNTPLVLCRTHHLNTQEKAMKAVEDAQARLVEVVNATSL